MSTSDLQDATSLAAAAAASAPQEVLAQGASAALPNASAPSPQQPTVNAAGENLQCQWQGCGERSTSAEALYVSQISCR